MQSKYILLHQLSSLYMYIEYKNTNRSRGVIGFSQGELIFLFIADILNLNQSETVLLTNFGNQQTTVSKQK
jgi:hypothetical protein